MSRIATSGFRRRAAFSGRQTSCATCVSCPSRSQELGEREGGLHVIVDDEYPARRRRRARRGLLRPQGGVVAEPHTREAGQDAPLPLALARRGQAAAVHLGEELFASGKADPEPSVDRVVRPVALPEHREDVREMRRRNSDAGVDDRHHDILAISHGLETDSPARLGVLGRVRQDVRQDLSGRIGSACRKTGVSGTISSKKA